MGLGTWQTFDVDASAAARAPLSRVLARFVELGGRVIDSSPMYGRSEAVVGELAGELGLHDDLFIATKVWTEGREEGLRQMRTSMRLLGADPIDLMQVHNLVDVDTHLETLRDWKRDGRIRYLGVTHYQEAAYPALLRQLERGGLDFVQLNYNVAVREAERRLLPACIDSGAAVLVNRPFGSGDLFRAVRGRSVPAWAADFGADSWARLFLKYVLAHPAVTVVIPATADPAHLEDNMGAGTGRLPDAAERRRIARLIDGL